MNKTFVLLSIGYLVLIFLLVSLSYQQGVYVGMKTFCKKGFLVKDVDGVISCATSLSSKADLPFNYSNDVDVNDLGGLKWS